MVTYKIKMVNNHECQAKQIIKKQLMIKHKNNCHAIDATVLIVAELFLSGVAKQLGDVLRSKARQNQGCDVM